MKKLIFTIIASSMLLNASAIKNDDEITGYSLNIVREIGSHMILNEGKFCRTLEEKNCKIGKDIAFESESPYKYSFFTTKGTKISSLDPYMTTTVVYTGAKNTYDGGIYSANLNQKFNINAFLDEYTRAKGKADAHDPFLLLDSFKLSSMFYVFVDNNVLKWENGTSKFNTATRDLQIWNDFKNYFKNAKMSADSRKVREIKIKQIDAIFNILFGNGDVNLLKKETMAFINNYATKEVAPIMPYIFNYSKNQGRATPILGNMDLKTWYVSCHDAINGNLFGKVVQTGDTIEIPHVRIWKESVSKKRKWYRRLFRKKWKRWQQTRCEIKYYKIDTTKKMTFNDLNFIINNDDRVFLINNIARVNNPQNDHLPDRYQNAINNRKLNYRQLMRKNITGIDSFVNSAVMNQRPADGINLNNLSARVAEYMKFPGMIGINFTQNIYGIGERVDAAGYMVGSKQKYVTSYSASYFEGQRPQFRMTGKDKVNLGILKTEDLPGICIHTEDGIENILSPDDPNCKKPDKNGQEREYFYPFVLAGVDLDTNKPEQSMYQHATLTVKTDKSTNVYNISLGDNLGSEGDEKDKTGSAISEDGGIDVETLASSIYANNDFYYNYTASQVLTDADYRYAYPMADDYPLKTYVTRSFVQAYNPSENGIFRFLGTSYGDVVKVEGNYKVSIETPVVSNGEVSYKTEEKVKPYCMVMYLNPKSERDELYSAEETYLRHKHHQNDNYFLDEADNYSNAIAAKFQPIKYFNYKSIGFGDRQYHEFVNVGTKSKTNTGSFQPIAECTKYNKDHAEKGRTDVIPFFHDKDVFMGVMNNLNNYSGDLMLNHGTSITQVGGEGEGEDSDYTMDKGKEYETPSKYLSLGLPKYYFANSFIAEGARDVSDVLDANGKVVRKGYSASELNINNLSLADIYPNDINHLSQIYVSNKDDLTEKGQENVEFFKARYKLLQTIVEGVYSTPDMSAELTPEDKKELDELEKKAAEIEKQREEGNFTEPTGIEGMFAMNSLADGSKHIFYDKYSTKKASETDPISIMMSWVYEDEGSLGVEYKQPKISVSDLEKLPKDKSYTHVSSKAIEAPGKKPNKVYTDKESGLEKIYCKKSSSGDWRLTSDERQEGDVVKKALFKWGWEGTRDDCKYVRVWTCDENEYKNLTVPNEGDYNNGKCK